MNIDSERQLLNEIAYLHMFLSYAVTELAHGSLANTVHRLNQLINLADIYRTKLRLLTRDNETPSERPRIVVLCGSTRFYEYFKRANYEETLAGRIVLSVGFTAESSSEAHSERVGITPEQKLKLDELYFRKIELADEVLVLNVGGYIGDSTRNEINHATSMGKPVRYLEETT